MPRRVRDFRKRLLVTFQVEAEERLRSLTSGLIELEESPEPDRQSGITELLFREVHSLKGAARAVDLREIEAICQAMEDVFAALKRREIAPSVDLLDSMHKAADLLKELLAASQAEQPDIDTTGHLALIRNLKELARSGVQSANAGATVTTLETSDVVTEAEQTDVEQTEVEPAQAKIPEKAPPEGERPGSPATFDRGKHRGGVVRPHSPRPGTSDPVLPVESIRIAADRLESLLLQVEELVSIKLAVTQRAAELRELATQFQLWAKTWAKVQPALRTLSRMLEMPEQAGVHASIQTDEWLKHKQELGTLLEFLVWNQNWVKSLGDQVAAISSASNQEQRTVWGLIDPLLQDMKQLLMLPLFSILEAFPGLARDLARRQNKEVQILFHGTEIEVDRRILQEIKDPLLHLVRNCIDHGIEPLDVREQRQKPRRGTIVLTVVQQDSSKFEILLADDGGGIDVAKVQNMAVRLGVISAEAAETMSEQEIVSLIFQSGFSTNPVITDISGRGLGLAIVQEKIEKLGGTITLETVAGKGTTFHLLLPLSLATLRGLLIRCAGHLFILPILYIDRVARIDQKEIQTVQNRETIRLEDQTLSLVRLARVLELPDSDTMQEPSHEASGMIAKSDTEPDTRPDTIANRVFVVILQAAEQRIAFVVDEILGEQEVLVKGLGPQLARVRNIAGATVLGTGQVVPILNVADLMKSAPKSVETSMTFDEQNQMKQNQVAPDSHRDEPSGGQATRILVVDDSITARMQLKNILELHGYHVDTAVDGLDALMALRTDTFDAVISDVDMPRLDGLDLTARIRHDTNLADLPVILVTTLASRQDQVRGLEVGANAYITKSNFDQNKLLDAIRRLI